MSYIVSFDDYTPAPRFDGLPWTDVRIEEGTTSTGPWTQIDDIALSPLDPDPANPVARSFTTPNGTAPDLWYRVIFADAAMDTSLPSPAIPNLSSSAPYATPPELFRILRVKQPSAEQTAAALGDLATATIEINAEIDLGADATALNGSQLDLVQGVCIDRAADLWRHRESAPGILGIVDESVPVTPGRYSWARYAARLSVLKDQWGIA